MHARWDPTHRLTRGFISMMTISPSSGLMAICTLLPPHSTPISRMMASDASRSRCSSLSVSVWLGATVMESPAVCGTRACAEGTEACSSLLCCVPCADAHPSNAALATQHNRRHDEIIATSMGVGHAFEDGPDLGDMLLHCSVFSKWCLQEGLECRTS